MTVQFSIYALNQETGEVIPGSLYIADDEHVIDLLEGLDIQPINSEFPQTKYLEIGRLVEFEETFFEVVDFSITSSPYGGVDESALQIKVYVRKKL